MDDLKTKTLPRADIGAFINSPRGVRAFEELQGDTTNLYTAVASAPFLTLADDDNLGSERTFSPSTDDFVGADGGVNAPYALSLAETGVTAGDYGSATKTIKVTVDAKGRVTDVASFDLTTDNVTEGVTNKYFTNARAREALSQGDGIAYDEATGEIALDPASPRNVDHSAVSVLAGAGLTGGGLIDADVTLALPDLGVAGTYSAPTSITVDQYGRITAIS